MFITALERQSGWSFNDARISKVLHKDLGVPFTKHLFGLK
jgi:hypothetical protein